MSAERLPAGQASTVVIATASVTGIATCCGHCHARLEAGITKSALPMRLAGL